MIHILDDKQLYKKLDTQDMLGHIRNIPQLCRQAWQMASSFRLPQDYAGIDKVVVLGMGGSAIGGDLVAGLIEEDCDIPVFVNRSYDLPAIVDEKTLVIAASYSGMTDETLSALEQAIDSGARKLAITTGGKLMQIAQKHNIPIFSFEYDSQPRAAFPFVFMSILNFIQQLGFIKDMFADVDELGFVLDKMNNDIGEAVPFENNKAKQLAQQLQNRLAVIYGGGETSAVACRWKTQFNENSKAWAFYDVFPELNHNAVVGYQFPQETCSSVAVIMLCADCMQKEVLRRYQATSRILDKACITHFMVEGSGESKLAQMMSLVLFGDYTSYYLALLNGVDPTPIEAIDCLKEELGKDK